MTEWYRWAAAGIIVMFYGTYLVKRIVLRRRGLDTARLGKGDKPVAVRRQERLLVGLTVALALIQFGTVIAGRSPWPITRGCVPLAVFGTVAGTVGVCYFVASVTAMRDNWRAGIDASQNTRLVTDGIYLFSRNPAFVGFDLMYAGFASIYPDWTIIVLGVAAAVMFHRQILSEEEYLEKRFGAEYSEYRKRTSRY